MDALKRPTRVTEAIVLVAILALAGGLRLTRLDLIEFKYDEATTARSALAISREGKLQAVGMVSSRGPRNPALMSYVLAPAMAISRDPRVAAGWVALLGVAAVGATYWVGRTYFGWVVAALASAMFAASPWAVFLSRKTWAETLPLLTLGFVAALLAMIVRRKPWALAGALAASAALTSLHLGGLAFFLIVGAVMALFPRRVRLWPLLAGILSALLILSPYILHDAGRGWENARALVQMSRAETVVDFEAIRTAAWLTGGLGFESLAGERYGDFITALVDLRWLDVAQVVVLIAGVVWSAVVVVRARVRSTGELGPDASSRLVLLCWLAIPVLALTPRPASIQPHALEVVYPVQHLLIALALADAVKGVTVRWGSRVGRTALASVVGMMVILLGWQVLLQQSLLSFVDTNDTPGGYGAPVKYSLEAIQQAESLREEGDGPLVALLPGADPRYDGQAAAFDVMLPAGSRLVDGSRALLLPGVPSVIVAVPGTDAAIRRLEGVGAELGPPLPARGGSPDVYRFFRWEADSAGMQPAVTLAQPARWESGASLVGFEWDGDAKPGETIRWNLVYEVEALPGPGVDLHWFNHLVDGDGNRWGQADGQGYPARDWQVGDQVAVWFDVAVSADAPAPPYWMRTGMYEFPEIANISLVDEAGNPSGQSADLGPIRPSR